MDETRRDEGVDPVEAPITNLVVTEITERERLAAIAQDQPPESVLSAEERERLRHRERSARKRAVGPRSSLRYSKRELEQEKAMNADLDHIQRPKTRGECAEIERPCPFVSCRYHLYLEASKSGAIRFNFPDIEVEDMVESCVLDVADRQGEQVERIAELMNLTRERIRQLEVGAFEKLKAIGLTGEIRELFDEGPIGKRRLHVIQPDPDSAFDEEEERMERRLAEREEREEREEDEERVEREERVEDEERVEAAAAPPETELEAPPESTPPSSVAPSSAPTAYDADNNDAPVRPHAHERIAVPSTPPPA